MSVFVQLGPKYKSKFGPNTLNLPPTSENFLVKVEGQNSVYNLKPKTLEPWLVLLLDMCRTICDARHTTHTL